MPCCLRSFFDTICSSGEGRIQISKAPAPAEELDIADRDVSTSMSDQNSEDSDMLIRIVRLASLCTFLALFSLAAGSQSTPPQAEWVNALRGGGHVIVFRHGATYQDQADTDPLNPTNVAKQRHLNEDGRALAKSIGESLRKLKIPVSQVYTSLFQRAIDTGKLMDFGDVTVSADYTRGDS
jgi:hypothetical protein